MIGIPLDSPASCQMNNKFVLIKFTIQTSVLKKKCHSIAYHFIHKSIAIRMALIAWEPLEGILAYVLMKSQGGEKCLDLCAVFMVPLVQTSGFCSIFSTLGYHQFIKYIIHSDTCLSYLFHSEDLELTCPWMGCG